MSRGRKKKIFSEIHAEIYIYKHNDTIFEIFFKIIEGD